jgi:outer membrane biosynthesis protein TonB
VELEDNCFYPLHPLKRLSKQALTVHVQHTAHALTSPVGLGLLSTVASVLPHGKPQWKLLPTLSKDKDPLPVPGTIDSFTAKPRAHFFVNAQSVYYDPFWGGNMEVSLHDKTLPDQNAQCCGPSQAQEEEQRKQASRVQKQQQKQQQQQPHPEHPQQQQQQQQQEEEAGTSSDDSESCTSSEEEEVEEGASVAQSNGTQVGFGQSRL